MARQLGTLTIDLIAKIGGFVSGMTEAERAADRKGRDIERKLKARAAAIEKAWNGIGKAITAGIAGITVGSTISKVITETRNAEQEQALLAAALKATGNQAGFSQGRLNEMATAMEAITTKSAGEFNQAQTVLLGFTNIVGEQLPAALKQAANFSVRTGADMKSAAETVGRALDIPSVGMASLAKQGFKFSESQIEAAQKLEQTGRIAESQKMILDALEETYGGAAEAARDTFGGAIDALRNTINGLLTGSDGSLSEAKKAVNDLTQTLSSSGTKAAFDTIVGWVVTLTNTIITATANIVAFINSADKLGAITGTDAFGKIKTDAVAATAEVKRLGDQLDRHVEALKRDPENVILQRSVANTRKLIDGAMKRASGASGVLKDWAASASTPKPAQITKPDLPFNANRSVNLKDGSKKSGGSKSSGKSQAEKDAEAAKKFIQSLQEQVFKMEEKTAYEKLFFDIQQKELKLSVDQMDQAIGLATMIDMQKEKERERAANIEHQNTLYELQNHLISKQQQYQLELMTYGTGDRAANEMRERIQLLQQHQEQLRQIENDRALALAGTDDVREMERINASYADRLQLTKNAHAQELEMYDDFIAEKRKKDGDWLSGAKSALATYLENAKNMYSETKNLVSTMFSGMEDVAVNFVKTGKLDFTSLADSILADITRIQSRKIFARWMEGNEGDILSAFSKFGTLLGWSDGGYTGPGGVNEPAGIAHRGEVVWSQRDISRAGGVGVVEAMRRGLRGYANGGVVGAPRAAAMLAQQSGGAGGATRIGNNTTFLVQGRIDRQTQNQIAQENRRQLERSRRLTA